MRLLGSNQSSPRLVCVIGIPLLLVATACGGSGGSGSAAKVATLGTGATAGTTAASTPVDTQEALLSYAKCMRDNGVDMKDPTFDANGNATGGGFGPDSGIDPRSDAFQTAQEACGDLIQGVTLGGRGGPGGGFDQTAVQASMNDFTACLRDNGLEVDDIDFAAGRPGGADGAPPTGGSLPAGGQATGGSVPPGGFQGGPPNGQAPGGAGFDPTTRIIERLGLDSADPAVTKAIDACQSILESAFTPTTTTVAG